VLILVRCASCAKSFRALEEDIGREVACQQCGRAVTIGAWSPWKGFGTCVPCGWQTHRLRQPASSSWRTPCPTWRSSG